MAWITPMTAVANEVWTSAQFNTHVRDQLKETAPAIAATAGAHIVSDGVNSLVEREMAYEYVDSGVETTSSVSYVDLATVGPSVTVTTGTTALIGWNFRTSNSDANHTCYGGVVITGATTSPNPPTGQMTAYLDAVSGGQAMTISAWNLYTELTPGSNTFTMKYRVSHVSGEGSYEDRHLVVIPF